MSTSQATSLDLVDTEYSACSVSTSPYDRSIFACGLYQIVKDEAAPLNEEAPKTKRLGRCLLMQIDNKGKLRELHRTEEAAILDMSWSHRPDMGRLAMADAIGQISFYDLENGQLRNKQSIQVGEPGTLALSLDWSNRIRKDSGKIVVSVSDGSVSVLAGESALEVTETWHAHDFEPWIAAWDYWDTDCIWTGGDDCKLKLWDLRQGTSQPTAVNKNFTAGVTTIQSHPHRQHIFAVGSYDGNVRLFDKRQPRSPLSTYDVGGGVWRVRWHPTDPQKLLTACMHDGFKVLEVNEGGTECTNTLTRFDEHGKDALAYGVDWCSPQEDGGDLIASCSFYDHQLRTWRA